MRRLRRDETILVRTQGVFAEGATQDSIHRNLSAAEYCVIDVGAAASLIDRLMLLIPKEFLEILLVALQSFRVDAGGQPLSGISHLGLKDLVVIRALERCPVRDLHRGPVRRHRKVLQVTLRPGIHPGARGAARNLKPFHRSPVHVDRESILPSGHEGRVALIVNEYGINAYRVSIGVISREKPGNRFPQGPGSQAVILLEFRRESSTQVHESERAQIVLTGQLQSILPLRGFRDDVVRGEVIEGSRQSQRPILRRTNAQ